jgi:hypothetical protein
VHALLCKPKPHASEASFWEGAACCFSSFSLFKKYHIVLRKEHGGENTPLEGMSCLAEHG